MGLAPRFRPSRTGGPTCLRAAPCSRSRFAGPGPRRASRSPALARPSLRHAATAAEKFRRMATTRRRRPPRGSRGLTPRPRARLHLLVPARSLTPTRISSPEPRARALSLAAPAAPPASSSRTTAPFPDCSRPQLRLAFPRLTLALAPPSEPRVSFPAPRLRRPWRHRARPPWDSPFLPFSTLLSCLLAFANASRTSCARLLALPWPETAAGRWPSRTAAPACAPAGHSASVVQAEPGRGLTPCWAVSPSLALGPRRLVVAVGQFVSTGWPSNV